MSRIRMIIFGLIVVSFLFSLLIYPFLPQNLIFPFNPKHGGSLYVSRFQGLFLLPINGSAIAILFLVLAKLPSLEDKISSFSTYYERLIAVSLVLVLYMHVLIVLLNIGVKLNMIKMLMPAIGGVVYYTGIVLGKSRRNWFFGIRTPWTLADDEIWNKAHRLGERLFKIAGVITVAGTLFGESVSIALFVVSILSASIIPAGYSYMLANEK